jgi:predicted 3-demethylubiquinone-9 3-methyltransferase (glyoxalase superfamily)
MQKITPFLWFDGNAEDAINFYTSVFKDSSILSVSRCGEAGPGPVGSVLVAKFSILGQEFLALNGGPLNKFTDAVSFMINCESQEEVDYYWNSLTADGGEPVQCGWLRDKFGLSWQVTPTILGELLANPDEAKAGRVLMAMMEMVKIDIAALKRAADG